MIVNKDQKEYVNEGIDVMLKNLEHFEEVLDYEDYISVVRNGGGFVNHNFFEQLRPQRDNKGEIVKLDDPRLYVQSEILENKPPSYVENILIKSFTSVEQFKELFRSSAMSLFGSGWTWLVYDPTEKLYLIYNTKEQQTPISFGKIPILTLDLWEHSYSYSHKNDRSTYVDHFWLYINWDIVAQRIAAANGIDYVKDDDESIGNHHENVPPLFNPELDDENDDDLPTNADEL